MWLQIEKIRSQKTGERDRRQGSRAEMMGPNPGQAEEIKKGEI